MYRLTGRESRTMRGHQCLECDTLRIIGGGGERGIGPAVPPERHVHAQRVQLTQQD